MQWYFTVHIPDIPLSEQKLPFFKKLSYIDLMFAIFSTEGELEKRNVNLKKNICLNLILILNTGIIIKPYL